ncbi:MAG TPA: FecR family protein [Rectinemataceae bacterium]|nr:FecR family protein [Rectinemataceae bacterium]
MNRTTFVLAASLAALALGCAPRSSGTAASPKAATAATAPKANLVYLEGSVKIDGAAAELGQTLGPGFSVETGANSVCDVVFGGKNIFRVGQNAFVKVDFTKQAPEFELQRGGLTSVLKKLDLIAGQDSYRVRTNTAVAGVRGTSFCIWADEKSTYVCACNGSVHTIDAKGSNELSLKAAHHTARIYSLAGAGETVAEAGILHHDDATVQAIATKIGYTVDWTVAD